MNEDDEVERFAELATSLSDGAAPDRLAEAARDERERSLFAELAIVGNIARAHRDEASVATALQAEDAPRTWGHLKILERVGRGAFGEVFRAFDTRLDREVALKLFPHGEAEHAGWESALLEEGRLLARVRHPNVVTVYGADRIEGRVGISMAFVEGRTLEESLSEQGPFGAREAAVIGIDLASALAAVHGARLLHRDVKAQNVMRQEGGRILLMDLGAGRDLLDTREDRRGRRLSGTPLYMAPELLRGEEGTVRSDLYSAGVLLYHLVTNSYPVTAATLEELRAAHARGQARLLRDARPDLPNAFVHVVERALSKDPAARFATAGEMEQALSATLGGEARVPVGGRGPASTWHGVRRKPLLGFVAAGAVALLLAGWWLASSLLPATSYTIRATLHRKSGASATLLAPGARVAPGDELFMELEATKNLYVYVVSEDEQGEQYLLFPLPSLAPGNPLAAGAHRLPGVSNGEPVFWQVTSAGGREHFLIVAAPKPLEEFEALIRTLARPRPGVLAARLTENAAAGLRGIGGLTTGKAATGASRLSDLARQAAMVPESARGVWIRQISLENPAE